MLFKKFFRREKKKFKSTDLRCLDRIPIESRQRHLRSVLFKKFASAKQIKKHRPKMSPGGFWGFYAPNFDRSGVFGVFGWFLPHVVFVKNNVRLKNTLPCFKNQPQSRRL